jgi:hypothetical protein
MIFAILLALSGLTLSAVAIYYSVIGLTAVFAAAFWPVVVMGTTLEISKLVAASWLKAYWDKIPLGMKVYMSTAVIVLMVITSMGIFGFLSKAHLDQNIISGDVQSKIAIYDEKIKTERENIDAARTALSQMDAQVNERLSRSTDDRGAERAVQIRRQQQAERTRLQNDISRAQGTIAKLNEERAPIAAEVRKVEAEVGPIKYIAALIYGDNPDANLLEKAVTWVIMIIVFVFDPLAVLMLLGAQMTYKWHREKESAEELAEGNSPIGPSENLSTTVTETPWPFMAVASPEVQDVQTDRTTAEPVEDTGQPVRNEPSLNLQPEPLPVDGPVGEESGDKDNNGPVGRNDEVEQPQEQAQELIDDSKKKPIESSEEFRLTKEQLDALDNLEEWNQAKTEWKEDNPNLSLKFFKQLYLEGKIDKLPWEDYVGKSHAKRVYMMKDKDQQVTLETVESKEPAQDEGVGYIQNEEQKNQASIWKSIRSKDE